MVREHALVETNQISFSLLQVIFSHNLNMNQHLQKYKFLTLSLAFFVRTYYYYSIRIKYFIQTHTGVQPRMTTIPLKDARTELHDIIRRVRKNKESFLITSYGKNAARIVPCDDEPVRGGSKNAKTKRANRDACTSSTGSA